MIEYITISNIDTAQPMSLTFLGGSISHETMENEYHYLNSRIPMTNDRCDYVKRTIDLPTIVNAAPQRIADAITVEAERNDTNVIISGLKLYVLPNGWCVQFYAAVKGDVSRSSISIKPEWLKSTETMFKVDSLGSLSEWQETDQGLERDFTFLMNMGIGRVSEVSDTLTVDVKLDQSVQSITLPLLPVE